MDVLSFLWALAMLTPLPPANSYYPRVTQLEGLLL